MKNNAKRNVSANNTNVPNPLCLKCKLYATFVKCFGLTFNQKNQVESCQKNQATSLHQAR